MTKPKVSILCIAYNQEKYIRKTLDSFVSQKINFDVEIIVADDCSTDGTQDIIREYSEKHPDILHPILRKKNIGAIENSISTLQKAKGEYIALCEGDDYWTDPNKLQKQVIFLDAHPDHALCFHPVKVFFENHAANDYIYPESNEASKFTIKELLKRNFIQTNSVMYRRQSYKDIPKDILPLDWYLHLYHAKFGKIGFIDEVMAAYRRHPGGLWWKSHNNMDEIVKKHGIAILALYVNILDLFGNNKEYRTIINSNIYGVFDALIEVDNKYKVKLLRRALIVSPDAADNYIHHQKDELVKRSYEVQQKNKKITELQHEAQKVKQLEGEIKAIKSSRVWRARNKAARVIGKAAI